MCVQCVWSDILSISNRPLQPPTQSPSINFFIIIIVLYESDNHTHSRVIRGERERERGGGEREGERDEEREIGGERGGGREMKRER